MYAAIPDANNAVRRLANEYRSVVEPIHDTEDDGRLHWSSDDVGEGETMSISILAMEVQPPGSEPECEFADDWGD